MTEQQERQQSWHRAITALAVTPVIFAIPLVLSIVFIGKFENLAMIGAIFSSCGFLSSGVTALYAFTIFFRKPRLTLGNPISQKTLWTLIAAVSPLITIIGLTLEVLLWNTYSAFGGIDLLSKTFLYGSFVTYIYAIFRIFKEKRKNS